MNTKLIRILPWILLLAVIAAVLSLPAHAAKSDATATLETARIAVGDSTQLSVTVVGTSEDQPVLPRVDGLVFTPTGESSEYQSINGVVNASITHTYMVTATRTGKFTIPSITIGKGSNAEKTEPLVLQVSSSATAKSGQTQQNPTLPAPNVTGADEGQAVTSNGRQTFMRLIMPKQQLHVGELVPVQVKAYFRSGVQAKLNGLPSLNSDAFTLNSLDGKPDQSQEMIDGHPYIVVTWTTALSAVKAGNYSLDLELPVILSVRMKAARPGNPFGESAFDDSFFDDFFQNNVEKPVTLTSGPSAVSVQSLPSANRPPDFNGALGQFSLTAEATPDHVSAGDPITLRLTITGRGNFDRVASGLLTGSPEWKSYKPVPRFVPSDSIGLEGAKTFEQAVLPLQSGHLKIPSLSFSYFDPETGQYVTRTTKPIPIEVAPGPTASAIAPTELPTGNVDRPEFAPNRIEPGTFVSTLQPAFLQPGFIVGNLVAWGGFAVAFFFLQLQSRRARDPRMAKARQIDRAIDEQFTMMDTAIQHAQTASFFAAARRALQQRLGDLWSLPPEAITLSEINARLQGEFDGIHQFFQMADKVAYSHENLTAADLEGWKMILTEQLKQLETR